MNIILILTTLLMLYFITVLCEIFTNAVEHLGNSFKIHDGALGSIFAAIGTAFPETVLPLIAVLGSYISGSSLDLGKEIGQGAVLGSPFMLSSLAFFVFAVGIILYQSRNKRTCKIEIDVSLFQRDLKYFIIPYALGVSFGFLHIQNMTAKIVIALFLVAFYLFYAVITIKKLCCTDNFCENQCEELFLSKLFKMGNKSPKYLIFIQFIISALALVFAAHIFVENIKEISEIIKIPALIISLFLSPIATELPETVNALVWSSQNKDTLAISNITGAMIFQACFPMSVGILFTDWNFNLRETMNVLCVLLSLLILYVASVKNRDNLTAKPFIFCIIPYLAYFIFCFVAL